MTLNTTYKPAVAQGNGIIKEFSYSFNPLSLSYIKVYFEVDGKWVEQKTGWSATFSDSGGVVTFLTAPTTRVSIERDVPESQPTSYTTSSGFQAKVIENSFDLLTGMVQELKDASDRSVKVEVGDNQTPEELLEEVYNKLDSATAIAGDAINAANQAQTAADNATAAVNQAEQTLTEVTNYVDLAKTDIENTKNTAISTIDSTVAQAKSDINTAVSNAESNISAIVSDAEGSITNIAVTEANKAIANAAQEATDMAKANLNSYVDGTVKPSLQTYVDQAQENASSAATSMEQAALSATAASNYANNASAEADNSAESAGLAANSAAAAAESEGKAAEYLQQVSDKITVIEGSIGDIGFAPLGIDETQNKRRYLNGQVISQTQFVSFTNKIKSAIELYPNLATSETNWQSEVTNSKLGQCGKFVIDDTAGTIRLPKVVNINGLQDLSLLGGIKAESLPNIIGGDLSTNKCLLAAKGATSSGAMITGAGSGNRFQIGGEAGQAVKAKIDASLSSSTYQDNAPVQQEAVQYPYFIQVATGSEESVDVSTEIQLNNPFFFGMHIWSDTAISNASWLISNGSYHSGATYASFYEWLLKIHNGTLTVDGVSVKAYGASGITDYDYVINTADTTFRLPVKVKLASGNAVAGNGMTLGLTDGTTNLGLNFNNVARHTGSPFISKSYGTSVGKVQTEFIPPVNDKDVGITTDSSKSGIETSSSGLKLYFYVGETVQDANVINAAGVLTRVANSIDRTVASDRETVVGWGMPDYSAGVSASLPFTAPCDGELFGLAGSIGNNGVKIGGSVVMNAYISDSYGQATLQKTRMSKGETAVSVSGSYDQLTFFPLKGVN